MRQDLGSKDLSFSILVGSLLYCSTLFFSSNAILIAVLFLLAFHKPKTLWVPEFFLVLVFVLFACANILFHSSSFDLRIHQSSLAVPLVLLMAVLAPKISNQSLTIFIFLTCIEIIIGAYELQLGQVALFPVQAEAAGQEFVYDSVNLYDLRVYGLSSNSSVLAEKIFLSILVLYSLRSSIRYYWFCCAILAVGVVITFNRTTILVSVFFLFLVLFLDNISSRKLIFSVLSLVVLTITVAFNFDELYQQVARGNVNELSHSELSRLYFIDKSFDHLSEYPLSGNGSLTYRIFEPVAGVMQHAHNSLIMLFSTHGLFIPIFLLCYIIVRLPQADWRILLCFFLYSLTQYLFFWNLSVPDMVLYWFLGKGIYAHSCDSRSSLRAVSCITNFNCSPVCKKIK